MFKLCRRVSYRKALLMTFTISMFLPASSALLVFYYCGRVMPAFLALVCAGLSLLPLIFSLLNRISSELKRLEEMAFSDYLTGAFNRRYLAQQLHYHTELAVRYQEPLSVVFLDIDYFKQVNDTYGHQTGDEILKEFAGIIEKNIRRTDILGRYGGEEFLVLTPKTDSGSAERLSGRLREAIENCVFQTAKGSINITASIGTATFDGRARSSSDEIASELLALAGSCCYEAKARGRNQVVNVDLKAGPEEI